MAPSEETVAYQDVGSFSGADAEPAQSSWPARRRLIALITGTLVVAALTAAGTQQARASREDSALRGPATVPAVGPEEGLISYAAESNVTEHQKFGHMDCGKYPYMKIMKVKHDNLGGKGPDKGDHSLIYDVKVIGGPNDGEDFEIHFKVTSPEKDFRPQSPRQIGLQGKYGSVNIKSGSNVTLLIQAFDPKTKKAIPFQGSFFFTFFDLDEGPDHNATESIIIHHYSGAVISGHSQVKVEKLAKGGLQLSATKEGSGGDNPKDPMHLTLGQFQKAVTVWLKNQDRFEVTFSVGPSEKASPRWFNFRGQPSLLCGKRKDGTWVKTQEFLHDGSSSSHLGGLVILLTAFLSSASLRRPAA